MMSWENLEAKVGNWCDEYKDEILTWHRAELDAAVAAKVAEIAERLRTQVVNIGDQYGRYAVPCPYTEEHVLFVLSLNNQDALERAKREARLEEAKWWESQLSEDLMGLDCFAERIAELSSPCEEGK